MSVLEKVLGKSLNLNSEIERKRERERFWSENDGKQEDQFPSFLSQIWNYLAPKWWGIQMTAHKALMSSKLKLTIVISCCWLAWTIVILLLIGRRKWPGCPRGPMGVWMITNQSFDTITCPPPFTYINSYTHLPPSTHKHIPPTHTHQTAFLHAHDR